MKIWNNISIRYKILLPVLIILLVFASLIIFYLLPIMEESLVNEKKIKINSIIETAISAIEPYHQMELSGELSREEAQKRALDKIRSIRYENDNYLFIIDKRPYMVMHPKSPELDGTDLSDNEDKQGNRLFVDMANIVNREGKGYTTYFWPYTLDESLIVEKISYVELYSAWGWIFGTGVYIQDIKEQMEIIRNEVLIGTAIIAALSIIVMLLITFLITKPIAENVELLEKIAAGNLTSSIEAHGTDETGRLTSSMKKMQDQVSNVVRNIRESTDMLLSSSEEINATALRLSEAANEQASNMEEITSSMEEIGSTIHQNSENSKETDRIAHQSAEKAQEGDKAVTETVNAMNEIAEKIHLVEDIAYQTNLLALNAAIEAARAGEHGKGFAVVASEVRKLAEKSQKAAVDISDLAGNSVSIANRAGELLKSIVPEIIKTADLVQNITIASEEQNSGAEQINTGMNQLNESAQSTAASSEELASTSDMLKDSAAHLTEMMAYFTIKAEENRIEEKSEEKKK